MEKRKKRLGKVYTMMLSAFIVASLCLPTVKLVAAENETVTVSFDSNGGSGNVPLEIEAEKNTTVTLPDQGDLANGDKAFCGWSLVTNANDSSMYKPEMNGTIYKPGESALIFEENVTFYATWADKDVNAEFFIRLDGMIPTEPQGHPNGSYVGPIYSDGAIKVGTFYTNSELGVSDMLNFVPTDEEIKEIYPSYEPENQKIIWYAIKHENTSWHVDGVSVNKKSVNLIYNPNAPAGTWKNMPEGKEHQEEDVITVSDKIPARRGYVFLNWNTLPNNSGTTYNGNDTFIIMKDTVLYAIWKHEKPKNYNVIRKDTEGNVLTVVTRSGIAGEMAVATEEDKTYEGYTFDSENSGNVLSEEIAKDGTTELILIFTKNNDPVEPEKEEAVYKVIRKDAEGNVLTVVTRSGIAGEMAVATEEDKTYTGYTFDSENSGNVLSEEIAKDGTTELILIFTKNNEPVEPEKEEAVYKVIRKDAEENILTVVTRSGIAGEMAVATEEDKTYEGYTFDYENSGNVLSKEVAADGSTEIILIFNKNKTEPDPEKPNKPVNPTPTPGPEPVGPTPVPENPKPVNPIPVIPRPERPIPELPVRPGFDIHENEREPEEVPTMTPKRIKDKPFTGTPDKIRKTFDGEGYVIPKTGESDWNAVGLVFLIFVLAVALLATFFIRKKK